MTEKITVAGIFLRIGNLHTAKQDLFQDRKGKHMRDRQYIIEPPSAPDYVYSSSVQAWFDIMVWSWREYQERLKRHSQKGYYRELNVQTREYSPMRILAEMHGFRRLCTRMNPRIWGRFTARERQFIRRAYELRDILLR